MCQLRCKLGVDLKSYAQTPKHNNIFGLEVVGFNPCKADPCIWLREMKTKYEYIAIYVDDLLIASNKPQQIIQD